MASMRERVSDDKKSRKWQVMWRENDRQTSATFGSRSKAMRFLAILESDGAAAARADAHRVVNAVTLPTLDEWIETHIDHLTKPTAGTKARYRSMYARTFGELIGGLELDVITRHSVARAINTLAERLAPKSIANAHGLISAAMNEAVNAHLITENPCRAIRLPEGEGREHRILTHAEFGRLYDAAPTHWRPLLVTLVGTGMRWGEATALQVQDVDLRAGMVRIIHAWKQGEAGTPAWGTPKSKKSKRTIEMSPEVVAVIEPLVTDRAADAPVFRAPKGGRVWHGTFTADVWQPSVLRAGLVPPPRIHDLRHTNAAWLIAAGIPLPVIQARLGHEKIATTIDVYGGLLPDVQRAAAEATSEALSWLRGITAS